MKERLKKNPKFDYCEDVKCAILKFGLHEAIFYLINNIYKMFLEKRKNVFTTILEEVFQFFLFTQKRGQICTESYIN